MPSSNSPVASAILAVYNAESTIQVCLESLLSQSVPVEIVIIDDGSTDQTGFIVRSMDRSMSIYTQKHSGPALARNLGATHAKSNILLFVDADMIFDKDYVKDLIKPIQTGKPASPKSTGQRRVVGTYTTEERVGNWESVWARCWNIQEGWEDKKRFPHPELAEGPKYGTDFRAILKTEFDRVGGFDNIGYTDTWSLFNKLGVRPQSTKAVCYHKNPETIASVFRQARWSAKRPYKFGIFGTLYALLRTSFPFSLVIGIVKSYKVPSFVIFKLVYDLGRFVGILEMISTGKLSK